MIQIPDLHKTSELKLMMLAHWLCNVIRFNFMDYIILNLVY